MRIRFVKIAAVLLMVVLAMPFLATAEPTFRQMFSIPREPMTQIGPDQYFELAVPAGRKVVITDVYVENLGTGPCTFLIQEQTGPNSFEVRYTYRIKAGQVLNINYTTGLRLGDLYPIQGTIRITNEHGSQAPLIPRVNGYFVP